MDILKILKESGENVYLEDLDFFETELATGEGYTKDYKEQCYVLMKIRRTWLTGGEEERETVEDSDPKVETPTTVIKGIGEILPKGGEAKAVHMSPDEIILNELTVLRNNENYKADFKKYIEEKDIINSAFVEAHFHFFQPWELETVVSIKPLDEAFLEKYFNSLPLDKVARYQKFSEEFFMKHFSQLEPIVVLSAGKNEWRKKGSRSKKLDVFLRLKGVKI